MNLVPHEYKFYTKSKVMSKLAKSAHNYNEYVGQNMHGRQKNQYKI